MIAAQAAIQTHSVCRRDPAPVDWSEDAEPLFDGEALDPDAVPDAVPDADAPDGLADPEVCVVPLESGESQSKSRGRSM